MSAPPFLGFSTTTTVLSGPPRVGILTTYPPTPCGLATYSAALAAAMSDDGADVNVVRVADGQVSSNGRVIGELVGDSPASIAAASELLNEGHIAIIQLHEGVYGGRDGVDIVEVMSGLRVPSIVVFHTLAKEPTPHQRSVLEAVVGLADQLVVMSECARERLLATSSVDPRKVSLIPHGATVAPRNAPSARFGRPTLLTWGLLGPGKGIERVIDAMASLKDLPGRPRYLIAGRTHPKVLAADGDAYREGLVAQAKRLNLGDSVVFDPGYRSVASLSALIQSAAAIVLPNDSKDQVTSGVLVDAIAGGRPVIATAFPHAVELLNFGMGMVIDHDDPDALLSALHRILTQPRLAGDMAAEARRLAPTMAWPVVGKAYLALAQKLRTAHRRALA